jgi:hypothetical protein
MWSALPIYNDAGGIAAASKGKESDPAEELLRAGQEKDDGLGTSPALQQSKAKKGEGSDTKSTRVWIPIPWKDGWKPCISESSLL